MAITQSLSLTLESQDVVNCTSDVRLFWQSTQTAGSHNETSNQVAYYYITVNGENRTTYEVTGYTLNNYKTVTILDTVITIPHGASGDEIDLPKIASASTISATDANIGSASMILIHKRNTAYTHSIRYDFGDVTGYIIDGAGSVSSAEKAFSATNVSFVVPDSFYSQIPNTTSGVCTLTCKTYHNGKQVGSNQSVTFTATASPNTCSPTITGSIEDINSATVALTGNSKSIVRYCSTVKCVAKYAAKNGATISSVAINGTPVTIGDQESEITIDNVESEVFRFAVTDSRGYTASTEVKPESVVPYVLLTNFPSTTRTNLNEGTVSLHVEGSYFNGSFGAQDNTLSVQYRVEDGSYRQITTGINIVENKYTVDFTLPGTFDYTDTYRIRVSVGDKLNVYIKSVFVKRGIPVFDWGEKDFAFHVPVSLDGNKITNVQAPELSTDVATKEYVDMNLGGDPIDMSTIYNAIYPVGSIYISYNHVNPSTLFGGTWERIQNAFLWAVDSDGEIGETGGEAEHALTIEEMPLHSHTIPNIKQTGSDTGGAYAESWGGGSGSRDLVSDSVGGGQAHNNMPPFINVSIWRRTA